MMSRIIAFVGSTAMCALIIGIHCRDFYTNAHVKSLINHNLENAFNRRYTLSN